MIINPSNDEPYKAGAADALRATVNELFNAAIEANSMKIIFIVSFSPKDERWGYTIKGKDDKDCAISCRRYDTQEEVLKDIQDDFTRCQRTIIVQDAKN